MKIGDQIWYAEWVGDLITITPKQGEIETIVAGSEMVGITTSLGKRYLRDNHVHYTEQEAWAEILRKLRQSIKPTLTRIEEIDPLPTAAEIRDEERQELKARIEFLQKTVIELDQFIDDANRSTGIEPPIEKMPNYEKWLKEYHTDCREDGR